MRRVLGGLSALVLAAAVAGCSSESELESWRDAGGGSTTSPSASESEPAAGSEAATGEEPLELTTSTVENETCVTGPERDYAWFEVSWKALADLEEFSFEIVEPVGVRQVGPGIVVPPVNYGGRIDYSGSTTWSGRADIGQSREVSWIERSPVPDWVPVEGQTGLVVLHLRFDGSPASIDGVRATWTTGDGTTGETVVDVPERWTFGDC